MKVCWKLLVLEGWILTFAFGESLLGNACFTNIRFYFWRKPRGKVIVLEVWIFTFGESLVKNSHFGSLDFTFLHCPARWPGKNMYSRVS